MSNFDRTERTITFVAVLAVLANLALTGVFIWGIIYALTHLL